ncbi:uncharacterized protein LOC112349145 [Selaginella moellendorffii]|uniref:uncharacterized protein LOC112349145 n=1 Tax=Selaginella moellendorffii TaxID=88036 RepID=UPI000D1C5BC2|nr:uncharacterized protein LOC112349145 [Selaginella moellendorffii]|eukprot:XP_024538721.1 uncharacterized protein LOC112349145 [Selaginella moellendorffii]
MGNKWLHLNANFLSTALVIETEVNAYAQQRFERRELLVHLLAPLPLGQDVVLPLELRPVGRLLRPHELGLAQGLVSQHLLLRLGLVDRAKGSGLLVSKLELWLQELVLVVGTGSEDAAAAAPVWNRQELLELVLERHLVAAPKIIVDNRDGGRGFPVPVRLGGIEASSLVLLIDGRKRRAGAGSGSTGSSSASIAKAHEEQKETGPTRAGYFEWGMIRAHIRGDFMREDTGTTTAHVVLTSPSPCNFTS